MEVKTTPQERREHKRQLIINIMALEKQIMVNQHDQKLLSSLRADYRRYNDELAMYYDDDKGERTGVK